MTRKKLTAKQLNKDLGIELNEIAVSKLGTMHIADVYVLTRILDSVNGFIVAQSTKDDAGLIFFLNEEGWIQTNEITEDGESSESFETYQDLRDHLLENILELSEVNVVLVTSQDVVEDAYEEGVLLDSIIGEDVLEDDEADDEEEFEETVGQLSKSLDELFNKLKKLEDEVEEIEEEDKSDNDEEIKYSLEDIVGLYNLLSNNDFDEDKLKKEVEVEEEEDILEMTLEEFEEFLHNLSDEDEEDNEEIDEEDKETLFNDSFDRSIAYFKDGLNFEVVGIDRNTKLPADQYYVVIQAFDKNGEIIEEEKSDLMQDFSINDLINETEMATEFKQLSGKNDFSHFIMKKVVSKKDERAIWSLK